MKKITIRELAIAVGKSEGYLRNKADLHPSDMDYLSISRVYPNPYSPLYISRVAAASFLRRQIQKWKELKKRAEEQIYNSGRGFLTTKELADVLSLNPQTIRNWIVEGKKKEKKRLSKKAIPPKYVAKLGVTYTISRAGVLALIQNEIDRFLRASNILNLNLKKDEK